VFDTHNHSYSTPTKLSMRNYQIQGILIILIIMLIALAVRSILPSTEKSLYIKKIEEQETAKDIKFYGQLKRIFSAGLPSGIMLTIVFVAAGLTLAHLKKAQVHTYTFGDNTVVVHERDLSIAAPIAMGLMNAQQLKQMNGGLEKAFELFAQMADIQTKHLQTLTRGHLPQSIPTQLPAYQPADIPTFLHLLNTGDIAPGKDMILGFERGNPRRGSFLDIYSAAIAGESGSGKTSTMLFLIGSGLVSQRIRFLGIDPHYPHPKSLGFKTKPLWESGLMRMATDKPEMFEMLQDVEDTIDNRLKQIDQDDTPIVLVIDELAFLAKQSIGPTLARTMERISTEGRKCYVYMLASSQTWLASRTSGKEGSSVIRDTLTSAYVHRIKPKQANLILQDKEEADKVKKYVKQAGEVLLCPVNDDSVVCKMPYTTESDMRRVANMVEPIFVNRPVNVHRVNHVVNQSVNQSVNLTNMDNDSIVNLVNARIKKGDLTQVSEIVGVSKPMISEVLNRKKHVSDKVRIGLINYLEKIVPFPEK